MGEKSWNRMGNQTPGRAGVCLARADRSSAGPRDFALKSLARALAIVVGALLCVCLDVGTVRADGPVVYLYGLDGVINEWNSNCTYLGEHPEYFITTIAVGQCWEFEKNATEYPGTNYDHFKVCAENQIGAEPPDTALVKLQYVAYASATASTSRVQLRAYDESYDSGNQDGSAEYTISDAGSWYTITTQETQGFKLRAYIGGQVQVQATTALSMCVMGIYEEPELPPEPEPVEYCPDGTEVLLSGTVALAAGGTWTAEAMTEYPRMYARYTFTEPGQNGLLHYIDIRANDARVTRKFYGDEMQSWDPTEGWSNDAFSFSVPNAEESEYYDYNPAAYVTGTQVSLYAAAGYNPLNLASVCLVPVLTSDYCEDGIEALEAGPVLLGATGGQWSRRLISDEIGGLTHFVVRYRVASPIQGVEVYGKFMPQVQANFFYVEAPIQNAITFTLPTTDVFPLVDDYLQLRFYNRYDQVVLQSVCIIDGAEMHQELSLSAEDCHLNNPDFIQDPATVAFDWETSGTTQWLQLFENGGMELEGGLVYQPPLEGGVWQLEVRASSGGSHEMAFGTHRTGLLDHGPQMKTETLNPALSLYRTNIFVMPQDPIVVESTGAAVDYVCLMERAGVFDVIECEGCWPEWNPDGSGDSLLTYLIKFLADYVWCFYCRLVQFLAVVANTVWIMLEDILLRIPALPNILSDNFWEELSTFLRLSVEGLLDWFGIVMPNIFDVVDAIINAIGRWLGWQWRRFGQWLDWVLYDVVIWFAAQLGETPQTIFDTLYDIGYEAREFLVEMQVEALNESSNALHLLVNTADVLIILASGVREGVSGNTIAYIGGDFTGVGAFIWEGVEFVNEAVDMTPLSGLNVLALGVIAIGLLGWSATKFMRMLEAFS